MNEEPLEPFEEEWKAKMAKLREGKRKRKSYQEKRRERRERFLASLSPKDKADLLAREERDKTFSETYKQLLPKVKSITVNFKNEETELLMLKDEKYGWFIRWCARDLLKKVIIPRKIHIDEYGKHV
jgi:hypothetical protein